MKKFLGATSIFLFTFINFSCNEDFSPKTNFQEKYFLFCIIQADGIFQPYTQSAVINSLYEVPGLDPTSNTKDPSVSGACVLLGYKDNNYVMNEQTLKRPERTGYDSLQTYYSCFDSKLTLKPYDEVSIHARLPKGTVLNGSTKLPEFLNLEYSYIFTHGITTFINKFLWGKSWTISWYTNDNYLFFPRLMLNYSRVDSNSVKNFNIEVPMKYIYENGKYSPVYPNYTYEKSINYDYDAIDSTLKHISDGDTIKNLYKNFSMTFTLKECDNNFSRYFASVHGSLDNYSLRFDESIYSNVNGGAGIVGSIINYTQTFNVDIYYLRVFGYLK